MELRLTSLLQAKDAEGLCSMLGQFSVSEKRTFGYLMANKLLEQVDNDTFWFFFSALVPQEPKAHLITFLKPASQMYLSGRLSLNRQVLSDFAEKASVIDGRKLLGTFLPIIQDVDEARFLMDSFCAREAQARVAALLPIDNLVASYMLFNELRAMDPDTSQIRHYCILLMQRGGRYGFNMASALSHYFGVENLPGTFSLRLNTYQLSRLEGSFDTFCAEISKK